MTMFRIRVKVRETLLVGKIASVRSTHLNVHIYICIYNSRFVCMCVYIFIDTYIEFLTSTILSLKRSWAFQATSFRGSDLFFLDKYPSAVRPGPNVIDTCSLRVCVCERECALYIYILYM